MRRFFYVRRSADVPWCQVVQSYIGGAEHIMLDFVHPMAADAIAYMKNTQ